jgi:hypothetical protein
MSFIKDDMLKCNLLEFLDIWHEDLVIGKQHLESWHFLVFDKDAFISYKFVVELVLLDQTSYISFTFV